MDEATAQALARRLRSTQSEAERVGLKAAMIVGGFDPNTTEPDCPRTYIERACSDARANDPAYLSAVELDAMILGREMIQGGEPF